MRFLHNVRSFAKSLFLFSYFALTPRSLASPLTLQMPPTDPHAELLPFNQGPRLVFYHQTTHDPSGNAISIIPLIAKGTGVTHVYVAAIHLNDEPGNITLNDHPPSHPRYNQLWGEVRWLQGPGVKVMGMLGGAAKGTYARLSGSEEKVQPQPKVLLLSPKTDESSLKPSTDLSQRLFAPTTSKASISTSKSPSRSVASHASSTGCTMTSRPRPSPS